MSQTTPVQPATQEAIVEDVCAAESLDIKSIEQQQMSKSGSECDLERRAKEAETIEDEVVGTDLTSEAQDESEYKKEVSNIDVVESKCNEEKLTNVAETNDTTNLQNTATIIGEEAAAEEVEQNEASTETIHEEVSITESSNVEHENSCSSVQKRTYKQKAKKLSQVNITRRTASDEQEDPLITKLDKKVDKELRIIQGNNNEQDDNDDDIDDETLNDLLYGHRAKELNEFLNL